MQNKKIYWRYVAGFGLLAALAVIGSCSADVSDQVDVGVGPASPGHECSSFAADSFADVAALGDEALLQKIRCDLSYSFSGGDDLVIVNAIRSWAYENIPRAHPDLLLESSVPELWSETASAIFGRIRNREGAFFCGGTSTLLTKIYHGFGYEAYGWNMGNPLGGESHVVTVVKVANGDEEILTIQDAYFDYTLLLDARPADLLQLLDVLASGEIERVSAHRGFGACKPVYTDLDGHRNIHSQYYRIFDTPKSNVDVGEYCIDFYLGTFLRHDPSGAQMLDWVEAQGLGRSFFNMFLLPISTSGEREIEAAAEKARSLRSGY